MTELIYKEECFEIVGLCFQVHNKLGHGFLEIVYKDALEYEFLKNEIPVAREVEYKIDYEGIILPHKYYADFMVYNKIIIEVKCADGLADAHIAQTINYLKVSGNRLGILVNFGCDKLQYKRIVV